MNVDLKFVFRSIVQVYQRYFNIHSLIRFSHQMILFIIMMGFFTSSDIARYLEKKVNFDLCNYKNKAMLEGSGDPQGNSAWGPISASSSFDSLPLLHQGR